MKSETRWISLGLITTFGFVLGCDGAPAAKFPDLVAFSGKVTLDGKPLPGAAVTFTPAFGNKLGQPGVGRTDANGKYQLKTSIGSTFKDGAVPGNYRVFISLRSTPDGKPMDPMSKTPQPGKESLKPEFSDQQKSKLGAEVPAKGGTKDFELKSK